MTHTTDQERAEPIKMQPGDDLHLTMLMAPHGLNFVTGKDREHLLAWGRDVWQASRRAQVVPEKESLRKCAMCDLSYANGMVAGWNFCVADDDAGFQKARSRRMLEGVNTLKQLAAAPRPPEAAPVQMPEPYIFWIEATTQFCIKNGGEVPFAKAWEPLYTEHQLRQLLAKHGINTKE